MTLSLVVGCGSSQPVETATPAAARASTATPTLSAHDLQLDDSTTYRVPGLPEKHPQVFIQFSETPIAELTMNLRSDPANPDLYIKRANLYITIGKLDPAISDLTRALALNPGSAQAHDDRGRAEQYRGSRTAALADYLQAMQLAPQDPTAYLLRGNLFAEHAMVDLAITDYTDGIAHDQTHVLAEQLYAARAKAYADKDALDQALSDYTRAIDVALNDAGEGAESTDTANYYRGRGDVYARLNLLDRALADYSTSLEISNFSDVHYARGLIYLREDRLPEALHDFRVYLASGPIQSADRVQAEQLVAKLAATSDTPTVTSTSSPVPTATTAPRPTSTQVSATNTPFPPTSTPAPPSPTRTTAGVTFVSVVGGHHGDTASVSVQTRPNAACTIVYVTTNGTHSLAPGLDPKTADGAGRVSWAWVISTQTNPGTGTVTVRCNGVQATTGIVIR